MSEDIVERIISDEKLLDKLVDKLYPKLKDDIVLKKIDELTSSIKALSNEISELKKVTQNNSDNIVLIWESNEKIWKEIQETNKRIEGINEENKKIWQEIQAIKEENKKIWESIKETQESIRAIQEENRKIWESIERLNISFSSFTTRGGHYIERTIMEVYKEALKLHGIDPSNVTHTTIIDNIGIVQKGRKYEVDFYESNDAIYVFEIKNFGDEGAIEQLEIREKIFRSMYNKPVKLFLIANSIEKSVKEEAEKLGIKVIAGIIVE